jgi:hypothetical protein
MMPRILDWVEDWIDIFHETYCLVDSSQCTDLELVSWRGGIRLHGNVPNLLGKKIPPAFRASVHLLFGQALYMNSQLFF